MSKAYGVAKLVFSAIVSFVVSQLGGADSILSLLVVLVVCDLVTGLIYAFITKTLSSTEMRNGIVRKFSIFVMVFVTVRIDKALLSFTGEPIHVFGMDMYIRTLFIVFCCLEEFISLLENLANIGVPIPKWLRGVLVQVYNCANSSTPRALVDWVRKTFKVDVSNSSDNKDTSTPKEEPEESEENSDITIDKE